MASPTQCTWVWANSGRWTGIPGVLRSMGLQRVRHDLETEQQAPILWLPDAKRQPFGKDHHDGKDWRQDKKGMKEDEMVGWHHLLNVHEFEQTLGNGEGQGSLMCCGTWGSQWVRTNSDWATTTKFSLGERWQRGSRLKFLSLTPPDWAFTKR